MVEAAHARRTPRLLSAFACSPCTRRRRGGEGRETSRFFFSAGRRACPKNHSRPAVNNKQEPQSLNHARSPHPASLQQGAGATRGCRWQRGDFGRGGEQKGKIHVLSWNVQGNLLPNLPTIHSPLAPRWNWHRHVHRFYCIILIFANKHTCTFTCSSTRLASPPPPKKGNGGRLKASG